MAVLRLCVVLLAVSISTPVLVLVSGQGFAYSFPDCEHGPLAQAPICNVALERDARVTDLINRMSIAEKIKWLNTNAPSALNGALPAYQWWSEALHGIAYSPGVNFTGSTPHATSFPAAISSAAAFNTPLVHQMGRTIGKEARAFNNLGHAGLSFFTPNVNPFRDPRWGRGQETPGEDPYLISEYMYSLVTGLQRGEDSKYLQIAADCKHYVAYDMENSDGTDRFSFNAIVSDQDFVETYLPSFESCVRDAAGASIMCSYNAMNGVPSCANDLILRKIAREAWGWDGFVVSDCDAIDNIYSSHHYTNTTEQTVQVALEAGSDLDCGDFLTNHARSALDQGLITTEMLDGALRQTLGTLVKLGFFDPKSSSVYRSYGASDINTDSARALALQAARESFVLLKNANAALPLDLTKIQSIALIGPSANATDVLQGNYYGNAPYVVSPLAGLSTLGAHVNYAQGCDHLSQDRSGFAAALAAVNASDVVIFVGGLNQDQGGGESEGNDRIQISFPGVQLDLIQQAAQAANLNGKAFILIVVSGGHVDLTWPRDSSAVSAIAWVGYPSQSGGTAMAQILTGKYAPAGRLVHTVYPADYVNQVSMLDMTMRPHTGSPGRTYKFYTGKAVYEFGHGLHYTTFEYNWIQNKDDVATSHRHDFGSVVYETVIHTNDLVSAYFDDRRAMLPQVSYRCQVTNTGNVTSDVSVLGFLSTGVSGDPIRKLFGFDKILQLTPGASETVVLGIRANQLQRVNHAGHEYVSPGVWHIELNTDRRVVHTIRVVGPKQVLRTLL